MKKNCGSSSDLYFTINRDMISCIFCFFSITIFLSVYYLTLTVITRTCRFGTRRRILAGSTTGSKLGVATLVCGQRLPELTAYYYENATKGSHRLLPYFMPS